MNKGNTLRQTDMVSAYKILKNMPQIPYKVKISPLTAIKITLAQIFLGKYRGCKIKWTDMPTDLTGGDN